MRRQPFTSLCQQFAKLARPSRADLHVHTTASDGEYTPSQVVALARQAGLSAVAITDHDTLAAVPEAIATARTFADSPVEVVPGVEITTEFEGREFHLLAYFVRLDDAALNAALAIVCASRRERFREYAVKLSLPLDRVKLVEEASLSLGRRHIAGLLLACGLARTQHEAFQRYLGPLRGSVMPKQRIPLDEAIHLVHVAGGIASLAHPSPDLTDEQFSRMKGMSLDAVEVVYAWRRSSRSNRLREVAAGFGFLATGGSDCHGPQPVGRRIGSYSISGEALDRLRIPAPLAADSPRGYTAS